MDETQTDATPTISREEWRWALIVAVLVMALTCVPYVVGALNSTPDWHFSGFLINVYDSQAYIAKMMSGAHGAWLYQLIYTPEPHAPALIFQFQIWLGKLTGLLVGTGDPLRLHNALVVGYHLARVVFGVGVLLVAYRFLAEFVDSLSLRRIGLILIALGGGLGWLQVGPLSAAFVPVEFYSPEAFTFLSLYLLPHLLFTRMFWMLALLAYLHSLRSGRLRWAWLAGGLWLVSGLGQPLYLVIAYLLMLMQGVLLMAMAILGDDEGGSDEPGLMKLATRTLYSAPVAALPSLPLVIYIGGLFLLEPIYQQWRLQSPHSPPPPLDYLAAWGVLALAALLGVRALWRRNFILGTWVVVWLVMIPALLYVPSPLQRRLAEGFQWPLAGLALLGLSNLKRAGWRRWLPVVLLVVSLPGSLFTLFFGVQAAQNPSAPAFTPDYQVQAYLFLAERLPPRTVVVSSPEFGLALPAYAPLVSFRGYDPETAWLDYKEQVTAEFYDQATPDPQRERLWRGLGVPYFVIGPDEVDAYGGFDPSHVVAWPTPLNLMYAHQGVSIWALDDS